MPFGILPTRKSEPKASARKPRVTSDVEKRVYCAGASGIGPRGAGSKPEAALAQVALQAMSASANIDPLHIPPPFRGRMTVRHCRPPPERGRVGGGVMTFKYGFDVSFAALCAGALGLPAPPKQPTCRRG